MKKHYQLLGLISIGLLGLCYSSCEPKRDPLMDLLMDFKTRMPSCYEMKCFDENSTDSTFITVLFEMSFAEQDSDKTFIYIWDVSPYFMRLSCAPPPPPPPPMPEIIEQLPLYDDFGNTRISTKNNATEDSLRYIEYEQANKQWDYLCDSLGHSFGLLFRGIICEDRLKIVVYGLPEIVEPYVAQHKLIYNPNVFRYVEYKYEEVGERVNHAPKTIYQLTDSIGNFKFLEQIRY